MQKNNNKKQSIWSKIKVLFTSNLGAQDSYKKYFFESLATMLASGIDIRTILFDMRSQAKDNSELIFLDRIIVAIENGTPIWRVAQNEKLVGGHYLSLIKIGELSGFLPENLDTIVKQMDRDREFNNKLRSASLYPSLVGALLLIVAVVLMTFVFPKILGVYESLNIELPTITRILIAVGEFMAANAAWFIPLVLFVVFIVIYLLFFNKNTKKYGQMIMFKIPGVGNLLLELELSRFGYLMNSLIRSGISLPESLRLVVDSTQMYEYKKIYEYMAYYIEKGYTMDMILSSYPKIDKFIPMYPKQLLINGIKARKIAENFLKIGEIYEKKNEGTLKDLSVLFEPILLLIIWVFVSIFAISIIMPMYSILGGLNDIGGNSSTLTTTVQPTNVINDINQIE